jgi:hypothetical protein
MVKNLLRDNFCDGWELAKNVTTSYFDENFALDRRSFSVYQLTEKITDAITRY